MTRKPIHRFLPLTYKPKIPGVLTGWITQSIRIDTDLQVGDLIAFHGWEGKPYHSPWSFRTPYCEIILAKDINVHANSVYLPEKKKWLNTHDTEMYQLAFEDGIYPVTGEELIRVLHEMNPNTLKRTNYYKTIEYKSSHDWARIHVTKPEQCSQCKKDKKLELHNLNKKYLHKKEDWIWVCNRCHHDIENLDQKSTHQVSYKTHILHGKIIRWNPLPIINQDPELAKQAFIKAGMDPHPTPIIHQPFVPVKDFVQIGDIQKKRRDNPAILQ